MLNSLRTQTLKPDEIIIVLKRSGDESESVIKNYNDLPINVIVQNEGRIVQAYDIGIRSANGDLLLFIDDDAIAEPSWVEKYVNFFNSVEEVGGASGNVYITEIDESGNQKVKYEYSNFPDTRNVFWRKPLKGLENFCEGISISGFNYKYKCNEKLKYYKSTALIGVNMAIKKESISGLSLSSLFKNSHIGFHFENFLAYYVITKGYFTYKIINKEISPTVFHIENLSTTRSKGWKFEFWKHYDIVKQFHRLKKINANVSWTAYTMACIATLRRHPIPRLLATVYAQFV